MAKKNSDSPEAVIASADAANSKYSGRQYAGDPQPTVGITPNEPGHGTSVPKQGVAGDPTWQAAPSRRQVVGGERNGARFSIIAGINKPVDPAVSNQTMANARILRPTINRSGSFSDGSRG